MTIIIRITRTTRDMAALTAGVVHMAGDGEDIKVMVILG